MRFKQGESVGRLRDGGLKSLHVVVTIGAERRQCVVERAALAAQRTFAQTDGNVGRRCLGIGVRGRCLFLCVTREGVSDFVH